MLLPERAVYWPAARTLLAADLHLGKGEAFRAAGVPVPAGVHDEVLSRLGRALDKTGAERLLVLGDLLHAPAGQTQAMIDSVSVWRRSRRGLRVELVPGNHDRALDGPAAAWDVAVLSGLHEEGPFAFSHEPVSVAGRFAWCGHLHPAMALDRGRYAPKLACFHVSARVGVLPAFTRFAAGGALRRAPGDRVFVVAEDRVEAV